MKKLVNRMIGQIRLWWVMRDVTIQNTATGSVISAFDNLKPEEAATVQSLNSRSAGGFIKNLTHVLIQGFKSFMKKFYAGYGHKSIADCGSTTIAADNISMLAAKGLQDWWGYNGQETSTRYIDVTGLGFVDPLGTTKSGKIMERWFVFYDESLKPVIEHLKKVRPKTEKEDSGKWETMLEKRAYDILGAFLPAGTRTNASAHMTLRQFDDKLDWMMQNPLPEIAEVASTMHSVLETKYPSTFKKQKRYLQSEEYRARFMKEDYYVTIESNKQAIDVLLRHHAHLRFQSNFYLESLLEHRYKKAVSTRPPKTELPKIINQCASYRMEFLIDYRSHRDLQRQRSATQETPLLTMDIGFEEWYLDQLPYEIREKAERLIASQTKYILSLTDNALIRQYYIPMGFRVFDAFTVSLADLIYIIELRTPTTVHPTARRIARLAYATLKGMLPEWFVIHADTSEDDLSIKRADHDILIGGKSFSKM